jgi:pseudouridylate synthase
VRRGITVSTPVPQAARLRFEDIDALTQQALAEATAKGITGKVVPAFLLARIKALKSAQPDDKRRATYSPARI